METSEHNPRAEESSPEILAKTIEEHKDSFRAVADEASKRLLEFKQSGILEDINITDEEKSIRAMKLLLTPDFIDLILGKFPGVFPKNDDSRH